MTRIGELFAGYGGLGMGVQAVLGGEIAWFSEFDAAPSKILAHHWPDVPNHGDITKIDWSEVEPVDILTGGFPCQDVSLAGARKGLKEGTRSGLWSYFAEAINQLRPGLVVIENVRGLLSAEAGGSMEPDPWGVGDGATRPVINALGAVLGDLADLGYDADWVGVRAADTGAPHNRYRIFIAAQNTKQLRREEGRIATPGEAPSRGARPVNNRPARTPVPDASSTRLREHPGTALAEEARSSAGDFAAGAVGARPDRDWGPYRSSVERWEGILGRTVPPPTVPTGKGARLRANPAFGEWMMGLPAGHVTDVDISWQNQWTALGNGVVPQQAALALSILTKRMEVAA